MHYVLPTAPPKLRLFVASPAFGCSCTIQILFTDRDSLVLAPWGARLSVIEVSPTATTYLENRHDPSRNSSNTIACGAEAYDRVTVVAGPSTAALTYVYTECGTNQAGSITFNCPMTATDTATCSYTARSGTVTGTADVTFNSSEASPQPCTIIAGFEKLSARAVTPTTLSGPSPSPAKDCLNESTTDILIGSGQASPTAAPSTTVPTPTSSPTAAPTGAGFGNRVSFGNMFIAAVVVGLCVVAGL
jgi:hypothetical protein